eukprot:TRINITY_DN0_c125_g1_i1.p1 TRINITY_DN0_c125_g1~~TRINITY_DN0_c125_g1_i1.p1  ORF type:complete len:121 (-),score=48.46 TRINITY_DN0_c125_g1_i1:48-410(-)
MPSKRRNNGRSKKNRGHVRAVVCSNCGRLVPKDKAIKRFMVRDIVDASSRRDLKDNKFYETFLIPKLYIKMQYCVSCAIHARIVRARAHDEKRLRTKPERRFEAKKPQEKPAQEGAEVTA